MKKISFKIIIMLLILSILLCDSAIKPTPVKAVDALTYTYWDLWYSISGAQHASMSAKEGPFDGYDVAKLKDRAKVQFDNFKTWLQRAYVPVGITVDMLVNQADEMIANAKTTGLEMSQELWDAFRQYFDDVANDTQVEDDYGNTYSEEQFRSFVNTASGGIVPSDFDVQGFSYMIPYFYKNQNVVVFVDYPGYPEVYVLTPEKDATFKILSDNNFGFFDSNGNSVVSRGFEFFGFNNQDYKIANATALDISCKSGSFTTKILAQNWKISKSIRDIYSPFIDYTVSQGCPVEVPETIPWRVYPKEETDDDTKIIPFPVEVPDEGTTEVPGEETTEKPNPDEDPDNDNDEENDPFPGIFPWFPSAPEIPEYKPWVPDDDDDPDPDPDPEPDPPPPPSDEDDPEPEPDPEPDPPPPPGKVEGYLNKLKTKFPFCIPFDMVTLFKTLNKTQKAPKWTFSYTFHFGDKPYTWKIVVDMADYDKYIQIFREGFFVLFLVGLFFATRKLISWQID